MFIVVVVVDNRCWQGTWYRFFWTFTFPSSLFIAFYLKRSGNDILHIRVYLLFNRKCPKFWRVTPKFMIPRLNLSNNSFSFSLFKNDDCVTRVISLFLFKQNLGVMFPGNFWWIYKLLICTQFVHKPPDVTWHFDGPLKVRPPTTSEVTFFRWSLRMICPPPTTEVV